jgi:hypothetical protein
MTKEVCFLLVSVVSVVAECSKSIAASEYGTTSANSHA